MARQMKDSGVEWIGLIPDDWRIEKGKHVLSYLERPVEDTDGVVTCFRDGQVTLRSNRRELGYTVSLQEIGYKGVEPGDLVVHGMDGFAGAIGISDSRGKCSPVLNILGSDENKTFLMYYLRMMAYGNVFLALSTGIRERTCDTNWNKMKNLPYPVPSYEEQARIAAFLDTKCAEIDKVVEQTRATIEEYKRLKQAIITEAVTKGVRGARPMKPSGVEWIGDMPEEWRVCKLKKVITFINGYAFDSTALSSEGDIGVIRIGDLRNGTVSYESALKSHYSSELDKFRICDGDILIAMSGATVGKIAIVQNLPVCACINQRVGIIRTNINGFIKYILMSTGFGRLISLLSEGTAQPNISTENIKDFVICLPDSLEQQEISSNLDTKCAEIDHIIEKKEQLIEELGRYKKSLIYEYVTGKKEVTQK